MNVKDSEIILCKGIKLDKNFENVLSYDNYDMVNLCRNNQIATSTNYSILDPTVNSIDVALPYASCIYANYIAFKNPHYGNKWFFGFVDKVKYVSNNCTTIEYKVDVFSTWYEEFNIGKAFIEREHVEDDTIGKHTLPENIDTGDFVVNKTVDYRLGTTNIDTYIVIGLSNIPENFPTPSSSEYNGVYSGLRYYLLESTAQADEFIDALVNAWGFDASAGIYTMFMVPKEIFKNETLTPSSGTIGSHTLSFYIIPSSTIAKMITDNLTFSMNNNLDGYIPKNNKLFTAQFNYLYATNNVGNHQIYKYEDFINNTPRFQVQGCLSIGCSIRMDPLNYKVGDPDFLIENRAIKDYGLVCGKFPTCSWNCDSYTNWLTTNAINMIGETAGKVLLSAGGFASGNVALGTTSAIDAVTTVMSYGGDRETMPNQVKGNVNSGDVLYSSSNLGFYFYKMCIKKEYATICDQYLSRFGYKVNEIKIPNLNSRQQFNFIKVGATDELITGDIPASDLEEINNIFRKGVTIFHNYTNFGDYTINNPIVNAPY